MPAEPPPRKILQPRKPPDPNAQPILNGPKTSVPMRKRRSTSPNSRDQRPAVNAKMPRNNVPQMTNNLPPSLIAQLDSRGLLKTNETYLQPDTGKTTSNNPGGEPTFAGKQVNQTFDPNSVKLNSPLMNTSVRTRNFVID